MIKWTWLYESYPFEQSANEKWKTILIISFLLSLIFVFLQPFGFYPLAKGYLLMGGYLLITLACLSVNYFSLPFFLSVTQSENNYSVRHLILFSAYNFILIGCWNHVFNSLYIRRDPLFLIGGYEILITVVRTLIVGLLASGIYALIRYNLITRQHLQLSQELNQKLQRQLHDRQFEGKEVIEMTLEDKTVLFPRDQLIYISSEGNYLAFYFKESKRPVLHRGRLKEMEKILENYPEFFRCHRSLIINLNYIESSKGNSQGLSLQLRHIDEYLPVSRPNIKALRRILDKESGRDTPFVT